jgi:hypothetical protein
MLRGKPASHRRVGLDDGLQGEGEGIGRSISKVSEG